MLALSVAMGIAIFVIAKSYIKALNDNRVSKITSPIAFQTERLSRSATLNHIVTDGGKVLVNGTLWGHPQAEWYADKVFHVYYVDANMRYFLSLEEAETHTLEEKP